MNVYTWEHTNKLDGDQITSMDAEKESADCDSDSTVIYWSKDNDNIPVR